MPFDRPGLVRQAGYDEGGALICPSYGVHQQRALSTTSTSFTDAFSQFNARITWDDIFPSDVQATVTFAFRTAPGTDETVDIRLRNISDNETIVSQTGITAPTVNSLGPTNYTPTTTGSTITIRAQIKTDPGTNSSTLEEPVVHLAPRL